MVSDPSLATGIKLGLAILLQLLTALSVGSPSTAERSAPEPLCRDPCSTTK